MTLLQLLTWKATSQEVSAFAEGEPEGAGAVAAVLLEGAEVAAGVEAEVAEAVAEVTEMVAGATAGVEEVDLGLLVKAKAAATGQAKPAEQQPGVNQTIMP